jgi:hypothetical protein
MRALRLVASLAVDTAADFPPDIVSISWNTSCIISWYSSSCQMESLAIDTAADFPPESVSISCRYSNFFFFVDILSIESISAVLTGRIVHNMKPIQGRLRNLMETFND